MSADTKDYQIRAVRGVRKTIKKCVDEENEHLQIDGERALHDVVHIVCKYVHEKDLNNMASVCQSWRYAVWREKGKRYYMQCLRLPYNMDNLADTLLDVKPCVSVIIYNGSAAKNPLSLPPLDGRSSEYLDDHLEENRSDFKKQRPSKTIAMKVDEIFYTKDDAVERQGEKAAGNCDLLGLFLPNVERRFRVRAAGVRLKNCAIADPTGPYSTPELDVFGITVNKLLVDELGLDECEHPNSTILFISSFHRFPVLDFTMRNCVFELCKRAQQKGKKVTLASFFGTKIVVRQADDNCRSVSCTDNRQLAVVLNISGPSVESWSTFIFIYAPHDEIERKLQQLKAKVKRKRHCTGLISAAKCTLPKCRHVNHPSGDCLEMMGRIKRVFPGIPFVGSFARYTYSLRPNMNLNDLDTLNENDVTQMFCFDRYVSIVIISHD